MKDDVSNSENRPEPEQQAKTVKKTDSGPNEPPSSNRAPENSEPLEPSDTDGLTNQSRSRKGFFPTPPANRSDDSHDGDRAQLPDRFPTADRTPKVGSKPSASSFDIQSNKPNTGSRNSFAGVPSAASDGPDPEVKESTVDTAKDATKNAAVQGGKRLATTGDLYTAGAEAARAATTKVLEDKAQSVPGLKQGLEKFNQHQEKVDKVQEAATKTALPVVLVSQVLVNPITWLLIGVMLLTAAAFSFSQVIGSNENAKGCADIGGSVAGLPEGSDVKGIVEQRNVIGTWLTSTNFKAAGNKPMTKEQAGAFVGNWQQESGLDPTASYGGVWKKTSTNADLLSRGSQGQPATGLAQWLGPRRFGLVKFAEEKNKKWNDIGLQLEYFKHELDGAEGQSLVAAGFFKGDKDVDELAAMVVHVFERSGENAGEPGFDNRIKYANEFMKTFEGGATITDSTETSGGSCSMDGGEGSFDNSDAASLAVSIAYPAAQYERSRVSPGDPNGVQNAPDAYKKAKKEAEKVSTDDTYSEGPGGELYASCDRFVATVTMLTMDKNIPWGSTTQQQSYLANSPKWKQYTKKNEAKPGDIWITKTNGHVVMYVGKVKGVDSIAHASYRSRVGAVSPASYLSPDLVDTMGRAYYGYHYIGGDSPTKSKK